MTQQKTMILACSGASNVGQLSNQAAVELTREVPYMVAIDGCSVGCIRAILEHAEVPLRNYVVLTELGIEKNINSNLKKADIDKVKQAVRSGRSDGPVLPLLNPSDGGCCGS